MHRSTTPWPTIPFHSANPASAPVRAPIGSDATPRGAAPQAARPGGRQVARWVLAAGAAVLAGCGGDGSAGRDAAEVPVPVVARRVAEVDHTLPPLVLHGRVEAPRSSELAFEVGGVVLEVLVDEGGRVAAGALLARLDDARTRAAYDATAAGLEAERARLAELAAGPRAEEVARARAALAAAEARLALARDTAQRFAEALAADAVAAQAESEARRGAEVAAADVELARAALLELETGTRPERIAAQEAVVARVAAELARLERDLADARLVAPFDARIERRALERGQVVAAGQVAFALVDDGERRVRVGVPAASATRLAQGDAWPAAVDVRGRSYAVDTERAGLLATLEPAARTVDLLLPLSDGDGLFVGERADVRVPRGSVRGLALPATALRVGPRGVLRVLVAVPDGTGGVRAEARDVRASHWLADDVVVTGALAEGELVIVSGAEHVLPGLAVEVAPASSGAGDASGAETPAEVR
jgi:multidrug efflux pump subunit AcrA (membrane-fusion protein)